MPIRQSESQKGRKKKAPERKKDCIHLGAYITSGKAIPSVALAEDFQVKREASQMYVVA